MNRASGVWVLSSLIAVSCASDPEMNSGPSTGSPAGTSGVSAGTGQPPSGGPAAGGGAGTSSAGGANCTGLPAAAPDDVLANFEEGTGAVLQVGGRGGGFYMYNDGTGMQTPPPGMLP